MAVVYEEQENGMVKAYSDQHKMIFGGFPEAEYDVAYDPKDAHRTYVETDKYIPTQESISTARRFSKLSLESALFQMGLLDRVDAFVDAQLVENEHGQQVPLRRFYNTANEFREDHPLFEKYLGLLKPVVGLTDIQIEQLLDSCQV